MKARFTTEAVLLLLFCIFAAVNTSAATLVVTKVADTADGVCDADCSLREAVAAAVAGDTVAFSALFGTPQTITLLNGQIEINKNLTITGPGSALLSISGNNVGRIFYIINGSPTVTMSGMKLRDARVTTETAGGAIYFLNGTLNVSNMEFTNNYIRIPGNPPFGFGAAIVAVDSSVTISSSSFYSNEGYNSVVEVETGTLNITNSSFRNNIGSGAVGAGSTVSAVGSVFDNNSRRGIAGTYMSILDCTVTNNRGGGVNSSGTLFIDRSMIKNNENLASPDDPAGGIRNSGNAVITNTTIANNRAGGKGGGIFNTGTLQIKNSSILYNEAGGSGGGIWNVIGDLFVTNSTVSGNQAAIGGAIYNQYDQANTGASIFLTNSTVAFNNAHLFGGGIRADTNALATLRNTIVAKNTAPSGGPDVSGVFTSQGFNLIANTTGSSGWLVADLLGVEPFLAPLGSNGGLTKTHALKLNSPALNSGSNALAVDPVTQSVLTIDQRGLFRMVGGTADIGAYEGNYSSSPVTLTGRVLTSPERGRSGTRVTLADGFGEVRYAMTNPSGYFRFLNLPVGTTFTLTASDKIYSFISPIVVTTDQNRDDLIFLGSL